MNKNYNKEYYEKNKEERKRKMRDYYEKNSDRIKAYVKEWTTENKADVQVKLKAYRVKNAVALKQQDVQYRLENSERIQKRIKKYRKTHREEINNYTKNKYRTDPAFRFGCSVRRFINQSLIRGDSRKEQPSAELLGCSIDQFKQHVTSQFTGDMTWDNRGSMWHLDHIIPIKAFKDRVVDLRVSCHYTNIRPLPCNTNLTKGSKIDKPALKLLFERSDVPDQLKVLALELLG